jgi:hypothetical protein
MSVPRQVLSEALQRALSGRRVLGALFLTFEFDPEFFELEVLPAVLDTPVSQAVVARLLQLEADLGQLDHGIAVFYDPKGLITSGGAPRLNVQRFPVRLPTGIFHPKNVLVLTEDRDADDDGHPARRLLVGTTSANLTRAGWWENVEAAHFEDLAAGAATRLKEPLSDLLARVARLTSNEAGRTALEPYRSFVRGLSQEDRKSQNGMLKPHFYVAGGGSGVDVAEFLKAHIPRDSGYRLEVISPFFDKAPAASPLKSLVKALQPNEVRVFLPRDPSGAAQCSEEMFELVRSLDGAEWGRLPDDLMARGRGAEAVPRSVHAKVYRVFKPHPKTEYLFVGSPNLTAPGHSGTGGNLETGVLVQVEPASRPDFWLQVESKRPSTFTPRAPEDETDADTVLPAQLRFSWRTGDADGRWDGREGPSTLTLAGAAGPIADGLRWRPGQWERLDPSVSAAMREELISSSFISVRTSDGRESRVLVQEDEMPLKPELMHSLPVRDILQYWSLLKPEQRQAFLERRAHLLAPVQVSELMVRLGDHRAPEDDMFQRCAGVFHSFASLETRVLDALSAGRTGQAAAWVFGERFDSLGRLLDKVLEAKAAPTPVSESLSDVDRYLILMSGQQLVDELQKKQPEFWHGYAVQSEKLRLRLAKRGDIRRRLEAADPAGLPGFLDWFDKWFLRRVAPGAGA